MNFYAAQEGARRASRRLVLLFGLSVLVLVISADLLLVGLLYLAEPTGAGFWRHTAAMGWQFHAAIAGIMVLVIGLGSLLKYLHLSAGGRRVAESVGATLVAPDDRDPARRRLLNIVEEMAIASGTPVPSVYLLEREAGVNAFAAGLTLDDAVVCVTRGCLELLNREQLQGVVAHEFSHILNGDMRLNLRVIGVLHGILLLGLFGEAIIRSLGRRRFHGRTSGRDGVAGLMMLGVGLMVLGYGGTFLGRLIKASVGRQREYLADASAVQFTRNPAGIAGALKVIGGYINGSEIRHPAAPAMSHMFLSSHEGRLASSRGFSVFATHPPLADRIRRIDPDWDGRYPLIAVPESVAEPSAASGDPGRRREQAATVLATAVLATLPAAGELSRAHIDYARLLIEELPEALVAAAREPYGARALVYALLLAADEAMRSRQLATIRQIEQDRLHDLTERLYRQVAVLGREQHLPVVDLALPALRGLSPGQASRFLKLLTTLARFDREISPFEWAVTTLVRNNLEAAEDRPHLGRSGHLRVDQVRIQVRVILSLLARAGHDDEEGARQAFSRGLVALGLGEGEAMLAPEALRFDTVDNALRQLDRLAPTGKEALLLACVRTAEANDNISVAEIEMLRAIAAAIHCPVPPVLGAGALFVTEAMIQQ